MIRKILYNSQIRETNPLYFDGQVIMREIFNSDNSNDLEAYFVEFIGGSLTTVHYHESEQILIPISGNGVVGEFTLKPSTTLIDLCWENIKFQPLKVGEIVLIEPQILHIHGAIPGQTFSHIAIRKMFNQKYEGNRVVLTRSQTIWAVDLIQKLLGTNGHSIVIDHLRKVSEKINENVVPWVQSYSFD
ncbi:conserved protein of unknown function [Candidatus Nitrosocosmicus franklandus]|uniref:Cupin n=2 Tax=Candidatus Nitrosocosmicus franklandianus TaxID=1798806 RepID=A0A484IGK4_9ARCH|nr:conserved protein of unknown function [Candidatus Nitrosocosmicus franklandus]